jgi:hypothetical protein
MTVKGFARVIHFVTTVHGVPLLRMTVEGGAGVIP